MTRRRGTLLITWTAVAAAAAAWAAPATSSTHAHAGPGGLPAFTAAVVMWQAMMIAMMAPAVTPWLRAYDRLAGDAWGGTWRFAAGYFTVWLGYSIVAATLQSGLARVGGASLSASSLTGGGVLLVAGLFQFTPMKAACLTHCRNPLSYLVASWHGGPPSAFGLGIRHGAYCVGCCWLLMITGFAVGLMHLGWMAMVTLVVTAEQTLPGGAWVGRLFGAVLVAWGGMLLAGA